MARNDSVTKRQKYVRSLYCKEENLFKDVFDTAMDKKNIQLSPEEGKLLSMILMINKSKYVLELGTLVGYYCCWIASSIPDYGKVITVETNEANYKIANQNFAKTPFANKIKSVNSDAIKYLTDLKLNYKLDAVFIDAKKDEYPKYLELIYTLLRIGGLIIADNTFLFRTVYEDNIPKYKEKWLAMKHFNEEISNQKKYKSLILPTNEGLTVAVKL